jgi:hypothetical protein
MSSAWLDLLRLAVAQRLAQLSPTSMIGGLPPLTVVVGGVVRLLRRNSASRVLEGSLPYRVRLRGGMASVTESNGRKKECPAGAGQEQISEGSSQQGITVMSHSGVSCRSFPSASDLLTNLHTRPDPAIAVPIRPAQGPVAIAGRRPVGAWLRGNDTADNTAEDGSARGITVVMMMVVVMILGELYACRRLLRANRIIGC